MSVEENTEENIQLIDIFKTLDYNNLDLEKRRAKYMKFYGILYEKCHMKFGSNFGIVKTSDYNLDLKERRAKYMKFYGILCENCNNEIINRWNYCCEYCYNEESDVIKKCYMEFGSNFRIVDYSLDLEKRRIRYKKFCFILCGKCQMKFGSNFGIFKSSDYNLDLEERRANYIKFFDILCEKCNNEINDKWNFCCTYCYNKETNLVKKNNMIYGLNFGIVDYNLNLKKRIIKYKKFYHILCEKCLMKYGSNFGIFNIFDHNLNLKERKAKYKQYDYILCEKCNNKINRQNYNCEYCHDRCKVYFIGNNNNCCSSYKFKQFLENFSKWISENKIVFKEQKFGISDYDLDEENRQVKYKDYDYILIIKVKLDSNLGIFEQIIQQLESMKYYIINKKIFINKIRYNRVNNCGHKLRSYCDCYNEEINTNEKKRVEFGKCKECSQINEDLNDCLSCYPKHFQVGMNWKRDGSTTTVALKVLNNSKNISEDFLNEIKFFNEVSGYMCVIKCFGITQDPITDNYALVLQYMENGDLRKYLKRTANTVTWDQRLNKIYDICLALNFGFCMSANEILPNSTKNNIYRVMPYMAPEILRGKPHTLASDIYSYCQGLRTNIREETPDSLKELIKKCWDANPENRPTSEEIFHTLSYQLNAYKSMPLKRLSYNFNTSTNINLLSGKVHPKAIYTSRLLNFQNLPEPINCPNQQEFITSRYIKKIRTGQVNTMCSDCVVMDVD
ncbi:kinase-like domain-containing protein [Rhizophagus clarus]|uniref:Kinase-like domain-containing protein n=1 Tax=Rhizophagus clarus TaxID=94130 RepID=A0A8H3LLB7_9GLOM|nr:kinase-like domain-containing protein [Rhizophagus clarus]